LISEIKKANTPVATAMEALSCISTLYQYEAIDGEERDALVTAAKTLIAEKTKTAQNRLSYMFQRITEKSEDRIVKKLCSKFAQL
jgi:hypothetical protein